MRKLTLFILALTFCAFFAQPATSVAQCSSKNTAFKSGETLIYDLYFNWKFIWVKVGSASMNTTESIYEGKPIYRNYLITRGSEMADKFFVMRDTLMCYTGLDLTPLYYRKGAFEGKSYRLEKVWYDYTPHTCKVDMFYQRNQDPPRTNQYESSKCAFDMLSMMMRARSFDASDYKKGHRIKFVMADGKRCQDQFIIYRGKKKFKMENSNTKYRCLVFSFVENEDGKEKEVVTFYITDDKNHIPVRLDMNLNFGSAKAFLKGASGLRNPQDAKL